MSKKALWLLLAFCVVLAGISQAEEIAPRKENMPQAKQIKKIPSGF